MSHPITGGDANSVDHRGRGCGARPPPLLQERASLHFRRQRQRIDARPQVLCRALRHRLRGLAQTTASRRAALTRQASAWTAHDAPASASSAGAASSTARSSLASDPSRRWTRGGRRRGRGSPVHHPRLPAGGGDALYRYQLRLRPRARRPHRPARRSHHARLDLGFSSHSHFTAAFREVHDARPRNSAAPRCTATRYSIAAPGLAPMGCPDVGRSPEASPIMFDHIGIGASDLAHRHSSAALEPRPASRRTAPTRSASAGPASLRSGSGASSTKLTPIHMAFTAESRKQVDEFYARACRREGQRSSGLAPTTAPPTTPRSSSAPMAQRGAVCHKTGLTAAPAIQPVEVDVHAAAVRLSATISVVPTRSSRALHSMQAGIVSDFSPRSGATQRGPPSTSSTPKGRALASRLPR